MYLDCESNQLGSLPTLPTGLTYLYCQSNLLNVFTGALKNALVANNAYKTLTPQDRFGYTGTPITLGTVAPHTLTGNELSQQQSSDGTNWSRVADGVISNFTFTSSDDTVATVNSSGIITSHAQGSCVIYAKYDNVDSDFTTVSIPVSVINSAVTITGYYVDNAGTIPLVTTATVANGANSTTALLGLTTTGFAQLSDNSYVPITIAWAFNSAYDGSVAGADSVTGIVTGTFVGGQTPVNATGTVTVSAASPTVIAPIVSAVTIGPVIIGDDVVATSDEDGYLYLVPSTTTPSAIAIEAAGIAPNGNKVAAQAELPSTMSTTGLAAGTYEVYAIDAVGNVSGASAPITVGVPNVTTTPVITGTPIAGDTSVSGTAVAGASVVLWVDGAAQDSVTADVNGNWTVGGLTLALGNNISVTAQAKGETVSNAVIITVAGTTTQAYTAAGIVVVTDSSGVTYATGDFTIPAGVTGFAFTDNGVAKTATCTSGVWSFI